MKRLPLIELERLILRPFSLDDAKEVQRLAGDKEVARMTLNIPYPYKDGLAEEWIKSHGDNYHHDRSLTLAVADKENGSLLGAVGIELNREDDNGELGYWIGRDYWNNGYCTEAAAGLLKYGFEELALNRIYANHLKKNPASGRIMQKIGMKYEGTLREQVKKWGEYQDLVYYGILKREYEQNEGY